MCPLFKIQHEFDLEKFFASKVANRDLCGSYEFCCYCNKSNKYPCAAAKQKFEGLRKEEYTK